MGTPIIDGVNHVWLWSRRLSVRVMYDHCPATGVITSLTL